MTYPPLGVVLVGASLSLGFSAFGCADGSAGAPGGDATVNSGVGGLGTDGLGPDGTAGVGGAAATGGNPQGHGGAAAGVGGTATSGTTTGDGGTATGGTAIGGGGTATGGTATGGTATGGMPAGSGGANVGGGAGTPGQAVAGAGGSGGDEGSEHSWEGCDEFELPPDCTIPEGAVLPGELRCSGLYSNWETRTLRCGVTAYEPAHELWADGAGKQRYVWLPPGQTVDASNPDDFVYPEGTRFWKEFYVGPEGDQKLGETRYMLKGPLGWLYTAYVWDEDGTTALQENDGVDDLFASGHRVPSREDCKTCHVGRQDFILGWDFVMLGEGATGVTARSLAEDGLLDGFEPAWLDLQVPGDEVEQAALAYLHANCGVSCHNTTLDAGANPSGLYLRLEMDAMGGPLTTGAAAGINKVPEPNAKVEGLPDLVYYAFRPGDVERSLVHVRMNVRGSQTAMPPLGTHDVDPYGLDVVRAWIEAMTEERGYPAPAP